MNSTIDTWKKKTLLMNLLFEIRQIQFVKISLFYNWIIEQDSESEYWNYKDIKQKSNNNNNKSKIYLTHLYKNS
jgi:hypothetical protein